MHCIIDGRPSRLLDPAPIKERSPVLMNFSKLVFSVFAMTTLAGTLAQAHPDCYSEIGRAHV